MITYGDQEAQLRRDRRRHEALDLIRKSRSIADDVEAVCGEQRGIGSLAQAVRVLSHAVETLLVEEAS